MDAALPSLISVLIAAGLFWRLRLAQRRILAERSQGAALARCLALLTEELQAPARHLLLAAPQAAPHARRLLDLADEASDRLATQAGPRVLREEPVGLGALTADVLAALDATGQRWRIDPALQGVTLRADPRALQAALRGVLRRMLREATAEDVIALRLLPAPDMVALVVESEGAGVAAADLDAATGPGLGTRGLGLGLATARDLMRAHGGDLVLESAAGIGTRAWMTLPRWRLLPN